MCCVVSSRKTINFCAFISSILIRFSSVLFGTAIIEDVDILVVSAKWAVIVVLLQVGMLQELSRQ